MMLPCLVIQFLSSHVAFIIYLHCFVGRRKAMSVENETDGPELLLPPEPHPQLSEDGIDSYYKEVRHCSVWSNETQEYIFLT